MLNSSFVNLQFLLVVPFFLPMPCVTCMAHWLAVCEDPWNNKHTLKNSAWNRISSLKVFHALLYRWSSVLQDMNFLYCIRWLILFWADWVLLYKYMKIKGLDLREISSLPKNENVMNNWCIISTITKKISSQDSFAYNESLHYPTSLRY